MPVVQPLPVAQDEIVHKSAGQHAQEISTVKIEPVDYKGIALDVSKNPATSIARYVAGSFIKVDYYSQVITKNSQLTSQAITVSAVSQQYKLIKGLEIKITTPFAPEQEQEDKMIQIDGEAIIFSSVIPNEGDMFTYQLDTNLLMVFRIKSSKKMSFTNEAVYEVSFSATTPDPHDLEDLEKKTIEELHYMPGAAMVGQTPIIAEEEHALVVSAGSTFEEVLDRYVECFYSEEIQSLAVPNESGVITFDPHVVRFVLSCFDATPHPLISKIKEYTAGNNKEFSCKSVLSAIADRDDSPRAYGFSKAYLERTVTFSQFPILANLRFSKAELCVYPNRGGIQETFTRMQGSLDTLTASKFQLSAAESELDKNAHGAVSLPKAFVGGSYILSSSFYSKDAEHQTPLDKLVWRFIKREPIDIVQVVKNLTYSDSWPELERFYYVPILLAILKVGLREKGVV